MTFRDVEKDSVTVLRRWLRDLLFADWGLKLVALLITLGLWYGVTGQRVPATIRLRGVQLFLQLPSDIEVSNDPRAEVELTLRGGRNILDKLKSGDVVANFDARNYPPGERLARLSPETVTLELPADINPESVSIERIEPASMLLRLERSVERELPVEARVEGKVPEGFELLGIQSVPAKVRVRGPESHVGALQKVETEVISLDGRTSGFTAAQTALDIPDHKIVPLDPVVDVQVKIDEAQSERRLSGVVVRPADGRGEARPSTATVELRGARSLIDQLHVEDLSLVLDRAPDGTITPRLALPQGMSGRVELLSAQPADFFIINGTQ